MKNSNIQWCDNTFNPWIGCTNVSPGCAHCYAETLMATRWGKVQWGKGHPRIRTSPAYWKQPLKWNEEAAYRDMDHTDESNMGKDLGPYIRPRVFCASLADWLDDEIPIEWLTDLLTLIDATPNLDWLLLTKRPENFLSRINAACKGNINPYEVIRRMPNIWFGFSGENQKEYDERLLYALTIPAKFRFASIEPMLSGIDLHLGELNNPDDSNGLDWVICGGESGPGARQAQLTWYYDLFHQCERAGVPFFMKQLGSNCMMDTVVAEGESFHHFTGPGKGGDLDQIPAALRVRQFPR